MAVQDLQQFLQQRAAIFDPSLDVSPGSPFDQEVIQPTVRRLGQDPFTVDLATFIHDRIEQAFPEMAAQEGDAITDLLIKPARLLWDPIVREINRIRRAQSLGDADTLTSEEAEALLANIFAKRNTGSTTRGPARIFFAQPRDTSVSPSNFFTTKTGLHFFPDGVQSITLAEMLLNLSGGLYYFDVNVVAEAAGTDYNIDADEISSVANVEAAVRVTNIRRFRGGTADESTQDFIDRGEQDLTERSMVTQRGIGARLGPSFPEISRLAVVGFGDQEMQRDVITGGGLGDVLAIGSHAGGAPDGQNAHLTRRFIVNAPDSVDFTAVIGPTGTRPLGYVVTLVGAFSSPPVGRDLNVTKVVSFNTLEVDGQVINPAASGVTWMVRKKTLTLSGIPGGILFPNNQDGTVTIPDDQIHVGGMFDIYARGATTEAASVAIANVADESPVAAGLNASFVTSNQVSLNDYVLGTNYAVGDDLYRAIAAAREHGFTLDVQDGPNAGHYRVVGAIQLVGGAPVLTLDSAPGTAAGPYRWRLVDTIQVDLVEPKALRVAGQDLKTVQNTTLIETVGGVDFSALGVSVADTLRILNGPDAGDYEVKTILAFNRLDVDRPVTSSGSGFSYQVFLANPDGGVSRPLVRVTAVELLDSSSQPVGTKVPYARPIDIQSRAFQNPGRGAKVEVVDARLGIVTNPDPGGGFAVNTLNLIISFPNPADGLSNITVTFSGTRTAAQVASDINAQAAAVIGSGVTLAGLVDGNRVGIVPIVSMVVIGSGSAQTALFGAPGTYTTSDIRSAEVDLSGGWAAVTPTINQDGLDALNVLDGIQAGFYGGLHVSAPALLAYDPVGIGLQPSTPFLPEIGRHIQVGARSIGSARCYFLDPTSIEFGLDSVFTAVLADGARVRYRPDPTVSRVKLPARPSTVMTKDGSSAQAGTTFTSASSNFALSGVREGDRLQILFIPITGTVTLADPVLTLALKTLVLSVDGGADQTITFVNDLSGTPGAVSRVGVAAQVNQAVGKKVCQLNTNQLEFEADLSVIVRKTGTANPLLGFSSVADQSNHAPHELEGGYLITAVGTTTLTVATPFPSASPNPQVREAFQVIRPGAQRCATADMQANKAEASLYYFDVELVSEGTGDLWNIPAGVQLMAEGYESDGYWLESGDPNLTFSPAEKVTLNLSRSILDSSVSDDPQNAIQLTGQNIEVSYDRSTLTQDIQNFALSDTERVVCANPLARHLIPHYVRFDLEYQGGSAADVVETDIENYVNGLYPSDLLESSDLQDIAYRRNATSVTNPIDLIAVVHNPDRTVWAQRSQNNLNTGRLAAFMPDVINVNRRTG